MVGECFRMHVISKPGGYMEMKALCVWVSLTVFSAAPFAPSTWAQNKSSKGPDLCADQTTTEVPQLSLSNGLVHALVNLPDADKGWYRGSRFDWSGVIPCLSYDGHTYFNPWRPTHDPMGHDSLSGPVEEFNSLVSKAPLGFEDAKAGDLFVKP